jgi:hypothetical protein
MIPYIIPYQLRIINFTCDNTISLISINNLYNRIRKIFPDVIILIPIIFFSKFKFTNLSFYEKILFRKQIDYISLYLLTYTNNLYINTYN